MRSHFGFHSADLEYASVPRSNGAVPISWQRLWLILIVFSTAMAWVESAVVFYLRTMIDRIEPYQTHPLPVIGGLGGVELAREFATLIIFFCVGVLAGRTWRARLAYSAIAFGTWDILYYVFLKVMCGWPHTLTDWDILFLLPLPWWGPVIAPVLIAILMIAWGTLTLGFRDEQPLDLPEAVTWGIAAIGMAIVLQIFMADALRVSGHGVEAIREVLPQHFNWGGYWFGLACMSAPMVRLLHRGRDCSCSTASDFIAAPNTLSGTAGPGGNAQQHAPSKLTTL